METKVINTFQSGKHFILTSLCAISFKQLQYFDCSKRRHAPLTSSRSPTVVEFLNLFEGRYVSETLIKKCMSD